MIEDILAYNKRFVAEKGYEKYITNKYPDKKIAILSCMDTRLTALLPAALGIKNGDVKMIKNAGGIISTLLLIPNTRYRKNIELCISAFFLRTKCMNIYTIMNNLKSLFF